MWKNVNLKRKTSRHQSLILFFACKSQKYPIQKTIEIETSVQSTASSSFYHHLFFHPAVIIIHSLLLQIAWQYWLAWCTSVATVIIMITNYIFNGFYYTYSTVIRNRLIWMISNFITYNDTHLSAVTKENEAFFFLYMRCLWMWRCRWTLIGSVGTNIVK